MKPGGRRIAMVLMLVLGLGLLSLGLWGLYSGKIISTWGRIERPPSPFYWITTFALILLGIANVAFAIWNWLRRP